MQVLDRVGYPFTIDAHHLHPVVWVAVHTLLHSRAQGSWKGLHVAPEDEEDEEEGEQGEALVCPAPVLWTRFF
jgi:hypothetical protein